ncbi:hypothetical protein COCOBI_05-2120 [Coccomyxa sp. Obi]|nr:hypothetical protein COCOBI_05-2120 [Coccomyxa sp. Obi]
MRFFRQAVGGSSSSRQQPATTAPELTNIPGDVEAGTSGLPVPGLTFRSSSRSSSPCAGLAVRSSQSDNGRQEFQSPRAERTQLSFSRSPPNGGSPSQSPTKPGSRGKERQLCLVLLLLLPAVTGLAVMGVRLRMSEAEQHSVSNMPSPGRFNTIRWDASGNPKSSSFPSASASSRSSNSRVSLVEDEPDGIFPTFKSKQRYQEMRDRTTWDPLPTWARRYVEAVRKFFNTDPVLTYLLSEGPATWTWKWLFYGKRNPAPLWDTSAFGPKAKYQWGSGDQLCGILNATDDIALVGNGPLTDEQRQQISKAGRVVRFNALNNRIPGERIDVWLVRYNGMGPANYWGFKQLRYTEAEEVVRQASGVVFLGGHPTRFMAYAVEELLTWYPFVPVEKSMQINITGYWDLYNQVLSDSTSLKRAGAMPSSGLLGVLTTVACMRPDQKLRIFGFNWNPQNWFMHKMSAEQKIINRLLAGRQVEINPTACDGMYTCDKLCDSLFYRLAKDGDKSTCEQRAKEEKERQEKEEKVQKMRDRQRAMDGMYGSTNSNRQAALQASVAAKVPDWVLDGSIKFNGNAGKAAESVGMTSDAKNDITLIGLRDKELPVAVEERKDGFLYNEHGERLGSTDTLAAATTSAGLQDPKQSSTSGIQQLAAEELLAMAADDMQDVEAHVEPVPAEDDYTDEDFLMEFQNLPEQGNAGVGEQDVEAAQQAQGGHVAGTEADSEASTAQNKGDMEVEDEEKEEQASLLEDADAQPAAAAESDEPQQAQQDQDSAEGTLVDGSSEVEDAGAEEEAQEGEQDEEVVEEQDEVVEEQDEEDVENQDEEGDAARRLLWDSKRRLSGHLLTT